jgi:hypothetical protein
MARSRCCGSRKSVEAPPGNQHINSKPSCMPPAYSYNNSRPVVPIGNSHTPVRLARPETPYNLVPLSPLLPRDKPLNQSAPRTIMAGILLSVSTLLTTVGFPQRPAICGNGGLARGLARRPSRELISAVSSPHGGRQRQHAIPCPSRTENLLQITRRFCFPIARFKRSAAPHTAAQRYTLSILAGRSRPISWTQSIDE